MINQNLCPFCFEPIMGTGPCPHCGHRIGEPMQGIQQLPVGWILDGKYRIGMTLGQGGFGITYLAYDMNLQQKVAIKEYFPGGLVTRSAQTVMPFTQSGQTLYQKGVDAFYREAQLLARFQNHPNIVHIYNFFRENNTAYFVMEYVEGKALAAYLDEKGGRLSQEETISLLSPIMDALDVLHQAGILHRDIAPDNIYLTKSGQVKLLDFGAAKNELSQHTHSSAAILKPGYAPLEQYSVTGNQGPWTDVYAMGAVIYRCLTGTMPPDAPDRITGREIIPIRASGTKVSKNLEAAVIKALSLNIPERWQRMSDFKNALSDPEIKIITPKIQTHITASSDKSKKRANPQKSSSLKFIWIGLIILVGVVSLIIVLIFGNIPFLHPEPTLTPTITATNIPLPTFTPTNKNRNTDGIQNIEENVKTESAGTVFSGWGQYDAFIKEIKSTTDFAERVKIMHQAEDMLMETGAILPIYYYNDVYIQSSKVDGIYSSMFATKYFYYATKEDDNTLKINLSYEPDYLDPALNSSVDGACLAANSFSGLYAYNADGELAPQLAEGYELTEDGLTYTFTLKDGLKWSDGSDLNAEDFVYSWKRAADPKTAADYAYMFDVIAGYDEFQAGDAEALQVSAPDAKTIIVTLKSPCAYMLDLVAFPTYFPVKQSVV